MISLRSPVGVGEVRIGDDLATLLLAVTDLADGDIVVVTSKVVSKAEGRQRTSTRDAELHAQTTRLVAQRGSTTIVRNHLGLTMAAAGIDASNVEAGTILLLPEDPDASAAALRTAILQRCGVNVAVIVSDTAGRPWRVGQTDIAIGAAGLVVMEGYAGQRDRHGNELVVTAPAVADELAGAAELSSTKLGQRPFTIITGRADLVLAAGDHGPGAGRLIRDESQDFFGFGAREAVLRALLAAPADRIVFGTPVAQEQMRALLSAVLGVEAEPCDEYLDLDVRPDPALSALAFAHGWAVSARSTGARLSPAGQ